MADTTTIEWTDATWNPVTGCTVVSAGCTNCYAMKLAGTRMKAHPSRAGLTRETKAGPVWNGEVRLNEQWMAQPLLWSRPRMIFVCAHGDLFHESVPDEWIDRVFAIMALTPRHRFQVLTKRADRMAAYLRDRSGKLARFMIDRYLIGDGEAAISPAKRGRMIHAEWPVASIGDVDDPSDVTMRQWPLPNVWLGVSVEDQRAADERIPHLLAAPAAVRFLSMEPLLGMIDLDRNIGGTRWIGGQRGCAGSKERSGAMHHGVGTPDCPRHLHHHHDDRCRRGIDWVIVGGESGAGARPMHHTWARAIRDQCAVAGAPFFFKQWGEWAPIYAMTEDETEACYHPAPERYPDASRALKVDQCVLHADGMRFGHNEFEKHVGGKRVLAFQAGQGAMTMFAIGKKKAGRLLDGVQHDGMPS